MKKRETIFKILAGILLLLIIAERWEWLAIKKYPNSTDSFFYLQEFKFRLEQGRGYYVENSLFFTVWSALGELFNLTPVEIFNAVFLTGLALFIVAILSFFEFSFSAAAGAAILMFLASDLLFYRHYAFLKQGFAVSIAALGASFLFRRPTVLGVLLMAFASAMHFFAAGISLVFIAAWAACFGRGKLGKAASVFAVAILGAAFFTALIFSGKEIFEILPAGDSGWWGACHEMNCSEYEWFEFSFYTLLVILCAAFVFSSASSRKRCLVGAALTLVIFLNLPIWTAEGDMLKRLAVSSIWIVYIAAAMAGAADDSKKRYLQGALCLASLILVSAFYMAERKSYRSSRVPHEALEAHAAELKHAIPETAFILAEHGLQFAMTYFISRQSASNLPPGLEDGVYYELTDNPEERCVDRNLDGRFCLSIDGKWSLITVE